MIKNKTLILDYIRNNPEASRADTAKKFRISTVTVSRLRKEITDQLQAQNDTPEPQTDNLTKHHIENECQPAGCNADSVHATVVENNYPVVIECVRECTWQKKLWQVGELATVDNLTEVPEHFRLYDPACPVNPFLSVEELLAAVGHTRKTQQSYWG